MNLEQAKALFFAQYLGQPVLRCVSRPHETFKVLPYDCTESKTTNYLLLRSVNQLTDEETITLVDLLYHSKSRTKNCIITRCDNYWQYIKVTNKEGYVEIGMDNIRTGFNRDMSLESRFGVVIVDYLRSISVLLPFTYIDDSGKPVTLQPDEIIALNWAKYH